MKATNSEGLNYRMKELSPKQMSKRVLIVFTQLKASNTSKNSLNEIKQIIY